MNTAIIVFCRPALAGVVKTRLGKVIGEHQAAMVYQAMLHDLLWKLYRFNLKPHIYTTASSPMPTTQNLYLQWGSTLATRMQHAAEEVTRQYEHFLLLGSDIPFLTERHITQAMSALTTHEAVIAPSHDTGYSLIGMKRSLLTRNPFEPIDRKGHLLKMTYEHLRGISLLCVDHLDDVDTDADLRKFFQWSEAATRSPLLFRILSSYNNVFKRI